MQFDTLGGCCGGEGEDEEYRVDGEGPLIGCDGGIHEVSDVDEGIMFPRPAASASNEFPSRT